MALKKEFQIATGTLISYSHAASAIAAEAGRIILDHYRSGDYEIILKPDGSPVTSADLASHAYLKSALKKLTPDIPVISEENESQPDVGGGPFWTIDPLDGTQNFIDGNDKFYVKIALIENNEPVLGIVYTPVEDRFHYAWRGSPAYTSAGDGPAREIHTRPAPQAGELTMAANAAFKKRAAFEASRDLLRRHKLPLPERPNADAPSILPHYIQVAEGLTDIYLNSGNGPSLQNGNGYSWDYAPDWLILKNAGGVMVEIATGAEVRFTNPTNRMNAMIGIGDRELAERIFPKLWT